MLTPAEWRVLAEVRAGRSNAEAAERLGVSMNTVRTQVSSMLSKLDLESRRELAGWRGEPVDARRAPSAAPGGGWLSPALLLASRVAVVALLAGASVAVIATALSGARDEEPPVVAGLPPIAYDIAEAVREEDADALMALVEMQSVPCYPDGPVQDSLLRCEDGDAFGTEYEVFSVAGCSGSWIDDPSGVIQDMAATAGEPYAVAAIGPAPDWWTPLGSPTYGSYVVVFASGPDARITSAMAFYTSEERIVRVQHGCRRADQFLEPGHEEPPFDVLWVDPNA